MNTPAVPFVSFGSVTSETLANEPWERSLFEFYEKNKDRYRKAADIGANIGIHSIVMAQQGWKVKAYEPDMFHVEHLVRNVMGLGVDVINAAVSHSDGKAIFVRVPRNTTENHLEMPGRESEGERIEIRTCAARPILEWADFIKMDCEGAEADILCQSIASDWDGLDVMTEIGGHWNAERIFRHMAALGVPIRAEKIGWRVVTNVNDMPVCCQDGSAFVGCRWPN